MGNSTGIFSSLDVALILKGKRKFDKSLKVFQHALALNPRHPRILNHYGEFIEDIQKDVLQADLYFARALSYSKSENEDYSRALENRRRTPS
ncbi:Adenosine monophosphate-protein transferase FICD-like protein [Caligus rogercresseyi]|uniref:Adenosine monophosphate-protein transferase FICD-like protein n=1 Tax=Caligus rogercresseyi TaxID=217165 RepID=A0A7T8HFX4_CALRO|nr:Adenosine monophosphate-protein transferase FICD-like protein [Caligus rogercresseyi]